MSKLIPIEIKGSTKDFGTVIKHIDSFYNELKTGDFVIFQGLTSYVPRFWGFIIGYTSNAIKVAFTLPKEKNSIWNVQSYKFRVSGEVFKIELRNLYSILCEDRYVGRLEDFSIADIVGGENRKFYQVWLEYKKTEPIGV